MSEEVFSVIAVISFAAFTCTAFKSAVAGSAEITIFFLLFESAASSIKIKSAPVGVAFEVTPEISAAVFTCTAFTSVPPPLEACASAFQVPTWSAKFSALEKLFVSSASLYAYLFPSGKSTKSPVTSICNKFKL